MNRSRRHEVAAILLVLAFSCSRCEQRNAPRLHAEAASEALIRAEARAFYRDLGARNWPALLDHFWPAKVAARWEPPFEPRSREAPTRISAALVPAARGAPAQDCAPADAAVSRAELSVAGTWARAIVPRCGDRDDELWMLQLDGRWKIVRLVLGGER